MRTITDALRLRASGLTCREMGDSIGVGRRSVSEYVNRAARAGVPWPLPDDLTDAGLEALLFPSPPPDAATTDPKPDWSPKPAHCIRPGSLLRRLGASNLTYAETTWAQGVSDWIGSHVRAFAFFGGVPATVASDNLKSGVAKACFHDPQINRSYADMAAHYDTAIIPARPRKPQDKAKVEVAVQLAQRWIDARLRDRRLSKGYAAPEFEAAADYALAIGAHSCSSLQSILKTKRYRRAPDRPAEEPAITHPNMRGADYFH